MINFSLCGKWKLMQNQNKIEPLVMTVPGSVYTALLENEKIPDPFFENNAAKLREYSLCDYDFEKEFELDDEILNSENINLCALSLDTICDIYLNGQKIASCNNMHITQSFDIKKYVKKQNKLVIKFTAPNKYMEEKQKKNKLWKLYTCDNGYEHIRKPHCMFGWDWAPSFPDMGIYRDIYIEAFDNVKIDDVYILQKHTQNKVDLTVKVSNKITKENKSLCEVSLISPDGEILETKNEKVNCENEFSFEISNPKIWWPNTMGDQPLYKAVVKLKDENGEEADLKETNVGLRTITVCTEKDEFGSEFTFCVNGVKIFAKGGCYVPEDILPARNSYERTYKLLNSAKKANYNIIRIWGGATYPTDYFFDICDKMGIMVWEDFMFACGIYDLTGEFLENVTNEAINNIKRLRNHPSLAIWCGNNEIEDAWGYWDNIEDEYKTEKVKKEHIAFFDKKLKELVKEYNEDVFYWPSSPSSGGGFDEPRDESRGDIHYWGILDNNEPLSTFSTKNFRFLSEFGLYSIPCMETIKTFVDEKNQNLFAKDFEVHQKHCSTNTALMKHVFEEFKFPLGLDNTAYASQILQGMVLKYATEHFRGISPRCMGTIYWQTNDCWPAISWATLDHLGRWKAAHYFAKRFFEPLIVTCQRVDNEVRVKVINDTFKDEDGIVSWKLCSSSGNVLKSGDIKYTANKQSNKNVVNIDVSDILSDDRKYTTYFKVEFKTKDKIYTNDEIFVENKYFEYEKTDISYITEKIDGKIAIKLTSKVFAKHVEIGLFDNILSDNYFTLYPNEEKVVIIEEGETDYDYATLKVRTVYDLDK